MLLNKEVEHVRKAGLEICLKDLHLPHRHIFCVIVQSLSGTKMKKHTIQERALLEFTEK